MKAIPVCYKYFLAMTTNLTSIKMTLHMASQNHHINKSKNHENKENRGGNF